MKATNDCEHIGALADYLHGTLSSRQEAATQRHLDMCSSCRKRLEQIAGDGQWWSDAKSLLADLRDDDSRTPGEPSGNPDPQTDPQQASVGVHLTRWLGPTDDPTKMGRVGPFEVTGVIGYGGAGVVLKAHDVRLNRYVALKVLLPALAHNAAARKRFERESRAVAAITHQNVVRIYAVDVFNGHPYLAMQYVGGNSLQHRLDGDGPLQVLQAVRIAAQIARALAAAHAQGVVHRDIKPANILLESNVDHALVTDFGLARVIDDASSHSGMVTGTPQYMSPEQCHGESADQRSDLFSLGSVMYAMCVGRPPFRAETLMGLLRKVCESAPRRVRELNPDIPEWLEAMISRLLEKQPDERFQSASAVADILEAELAHMQNPIAVAMPPRDWLKRSINTSTNLNNKRNALMTLTATALVAALLFTIPQTGDDSVPQDSAAEQQESPAADRAPARPEQLSLFQTKEERTFPVRSGGKLTLATDRGHVEVSTAEIEEVQLEIIRKVAAIDQDEADQISSKHPLEITQNGTDLKVEAKLAKSIDSALVRKVEVSVNEQREVQVEVLREVKVSNEEEADQINVQHELKFSQDDADLKLARKIQKPAKLDQIRGVTFLVTVPKKYNLDVSTSGGHIQLGDLQGSVLARTGGGQVSVVDVEGAVDVKTGGGSVSVTNVEGTVDAMTDGGTVRVANVEGAVNAITGGGTVMAELLTQPSEDWLLRTGGGNVKVQLSEEIAVNVRARTGGGHINVPFATPDNKKRRKRNIEVALNGGGPLLTAETGGGNVTMQYSKE